MSEVCLNRGDDVLMHLSAFREVAQAAGRDPATIAITAFNPPVDPHTLKRYRGAGVERVAFSIAAEDKDKTLATLDKLAGEMRQVG